ncbi:Hint domain-containing protein [Paracoccus saliphilus]|uniref:Hint domain-containing protein n=1 Tax=Paracoccus saliphilus TaxID=405559 RepID=A0AA45W517_9RHOB|nr:Hint domain-containing protein [Paracoccus saliphilus]WCR02089.1 Hint domain-containing protein [Paracoccus saliphilus]SIS89859.1 Hint domain-containing protein [Paracoccus saliphilus]
MTIYNIHVIYLGNVGIEDWDTDSSTSRPNPLENINSFIGYDSSAEFGDTLWKQAETATIDSNIDEIRDLVYEDSTYTPGGPYANKDWEISYFDDSATITWSGGEAQYIDSFAAIELAVTFADDPENPVSGTARFLQTQAGDTFLLSYDHNSEDIFGYEFDIASRPIASLEVVDIGFETIGNIYGTEYDDQPFATCFTRGTLISTCDSEHPIEALSIGDLVHTRDSGMQPVRWIGTRHFTEADLDAAPNLRPIRIKKESLGGDTPFRDLIVSPQHRVLVRNKIAMRMFGEPEVLIAAKHLTEIDGIDVADDLQGVEYFHILFDRHQIVRSNGAETESMYTGKMALKSIPREQIEEIFAIFPELRHMSEDESTAPARFLVPGRKARKLAIRARKNSCELYDGVLPSAP